MKTSVTLKQNGNIELFANLVGTWHYEDVWASYGRTDKSGNRLVKGFFHAYLINGEHIFEYTRKELKEAIEDKWVELVHIAVLSTEEQKQDAINRVEIFAECEVRNIDELTGKK